MGLLLGLAACASTARASEPVAVAPLSIGEQLDFHSQGLDQRRRLNVYLPPSYAGSDARYPVIYLLDGSMDEDFLHVVGLTQFASYSWINWLPESIVVGIANVDRRHDFTFPSNNPEMLDAIPNSGGSAEFIRFLAEEVQPMIARRYRVSSQRTLIGQSAGGLLATEILFKRPELFDRYLIVSPSLWWDDEALLNMPVPKFSSPNTIYIGVGSAEDPIMRRTSRQLADKLIADAPEASRVEFRMLDGMDHGNILHQALYEAIRSLAPPPAAQSGG